ncbi:1,4-beta cellobiohydrolase [Sodiomyces alkalinus F11]|uniref:Glucanase n=1 Tax=Sodiomyces alkalinus (strain CBS 110278 / VKM F-3762 / F11) TaxID=1314773 RepID=A0A3N2QA80_SODAK|nr:1,4-beta cellobiohydrolase [Sodiomyces alkalinus F11]ROT43659.1 1,4-beta cellobiohydrolase [Sodiomyces alkalinus F11]
MRSALALLAAGLAATSCASAIPELEPRQSANPFAGRSLYINPNYSASLEQTRLAFVSRGDTANANKVQYVQNHVGTFVWVANIYLLRRIDEAIQNARAAQARGEGQQIVGLVLYNLPDRDCSAGESAGELSLNQNGLNRYRSEYVNPFAEKLKAASDLQFAVVMEPDALGNMVTAQSQPFCANARIPHQDGIAYAIQQMQASNIHLYLDVSHGGWLGWSDNLGPSTSLPADEVGRILQKAGGNNRIRGYSTNVSNYNAYMTNNPPPFTEGNPSADESRYATSLGGALAQRGLPTKFIVDQGRVAIDGARETGGEWCNVEAGFGQPFITNTQNSNVDAVLWIKPGGESDGQCGMQGAPIAGAWFDEYAQMLTRNAHSDIVGGGPPPSNPPPSNPPPTNPPPTNPPPTNPPPTNPPPSGSCSAMWGQCGGQGWNGPTCCSQGTCSEQNPWYSQCI